MDWPHRYRVSFSTRTGGVVRYHVVSWRGPEKAIAWAALRHSDVDGDEKAVIADVEVEDLGRCPSNPDGTVLVESNELVDRFEF